MATLSTALKTEALTEQFREVTLEDKAWIDPLFRYQQFKACVYSFANLYLWSEQYRVVIANIGGFLIIKGQSPRPSFAYPIGGGSADELREVIEALIEHARRGGYPLRMHGLVAEARAQLEALFPGRFEFHENRDDADYIYSAESLITLAGKKLSAKRNHINNFLRTHPDWQFEEMRNGNLDECREMAVKWCEMNDCADDPGKQSELLAVRKALRHFEALELSGGLIRAQGEVIAFSLGERLTDDTFVVHIEKTFSDIQGAYPMINREFAKHFAAGYRYINREEDMGVPGLRKAKLSYHPEIILDKYAATYKA